MCTEFNSVKCMPSILTNNKQKKHQKQQRKQQQQQNRLEFIEIDDHIINND